MPISKEIMRLWKAWLCFKLGGQKSNQRPFCFQAYLLSLRPWQKCFPWPSPSSSSDFVRLIKESNHCHKRKQVLLTLPSRERQLDKRISGLCLLGQSPWVISLKPWLIYTPVLNRYSWRWSLEENIWILGRRISTWWLRTSVNSSDAFQGRLMCKCDSFKAPILCNFDRFDKFLFP